MSGDYILSGLLRCGKCGATMKGIKKKDKNYEYFYYGCSTRHKYGKASCDQKNIKKDKIESIVFEKLREHWKQFIHIQSYTECIDIVERLSGGVKSEISKIKVNAATTFKWRDNLLVTEAIIPTELVNKLKQLTTFYNILQKRKQFFLQHDYETDIIKRLLGEIEKKEEISLFIKEIVVTDNHAEIEMY